MSSGDLSAAAHCDPFIVLMTVCNPHDVMNRRCYHFMKHMADALPNVPLTFLYVRVKKPTIIPILPAFKNVFENTDGARACARIGRRGTLFTIL